LKPGRGTNHGEGCSGILARTKRRDGATLVMVDALMKPIQSLLLDSPALSLFLSRDITHPHGCVELPKHYCS